MDETSPNLGTIFGRAIEIESPDERDRYLAEACAGDSALRDEVEDLLRARHDLGGFLERPAVLLTDPGGAVPAVEERGTVIGRYVLVEKIGSGGMGVVYRAQQTAPLRRAVALKLIKPGMDTHQVIERFEAERQALALMDHPGIALVLDAGTTATGRPYFVMELVDGIPITEYCDRHRLEVVDRLGLFVRVCEAVQHAHQKGIIHRDLKPSNVLVAAVDGRPAPKVIDFGVAKAIEPSSAERTRLTRHGTVVGTPQYMSPEQAKGDGEDVDTRADVYALGVLLYELLTGSTPLEPRQIREAGFDEVRHIIREHEPPRPSARLSSSDRIASIAASRNTDGSRLTRQVRGDLDRITMRALEKERSRRYATTGDLARDVLRYLANEPIEAGPPSAAYHLRKFVRRHRAALLVVGAFLGLLVTASVVSVALAVNARRAEADVRAVLSFLRDRVLAAPRPEDQDGGLGRGVTLRAALDAAEPQIEPELSGHPVVEAAVRDGLGESYWYLGEPALAARQHERALRLRTVALGPDHPDTLTSANHLAAAWADAGRNDEAMALNRANLAARQRVLGPDHPDTLTSRNNLAADLARAGRNDEAITLFGQVLARRTALLGRGHADTLTTLNNLGMLYSNTDRVDDAVRLLDEAIAIQSRTLGPAHPSTLLTVNNLASAYVNAGRLAEAIPLFRRVLEAQRARLGPDHPHTLRTMSNLAAVAWAGGRRAEAIGLFEEVLKAQRAKLGDDHPDTLTMGFNLAVSYRTVGRPAEAIPLFERALAAYRRTPGPADPGTLDTMNSLAAAYLDAGRWDPAATLLRECLGLRATNTPDHWRHYQTMSQLGAALAGLDRPAEAEPLLIAGALGLKEREAQVPAAVKAVVAEASARVAAFYEASGQLEKAAGWRAKHAPATVAPQPAS